jgi:hypothetical protein
MRTRFKTIVTAGVIAVVAGGIGVGYYQTQQGSSGTCTIDDTSGCVAAAGRTLTINNAAAATPDSSIHFWICNTTLTAENQSGATITGSGFPVRVDINFNAGTTLERDGASIEPGCLGDTDADCATSIDLILEIEGNGVDTGFSADAVKQKLAGTPTCGIQITGTVNCGPPPTGAHPDGIQAQGLSNVSWVDFEVADYDSGEATCQGAGGAFFYSSAGANAATNTHVIRGKYIACNTSFQDGDSGINTGSVNGALFRGGRTESAATGGTPACEGYPGTTACAEFPSPGFNNPDVTKTNIDCEQWNPTTNAWQDE